MSLLHRFVLSNQHQNTQRNHIACIENDYAGKSCEQLFQILGNTQDQDLISGLEKTTPLSWLYTQRDSASDSAKSTLISTIHVLKNDAYCVFLFLVNTDNKKD